MKTLSWALWWGFVALGCVRCDERVAGERTALCVQNGADNMSEPYPSGLDDPLGTPLGAEIYTSTLGESREGRRGHALQCPTRENRPAGHNRADRAKESRSEKSTNECRANCESCEGPSGWPSACRGRGVGAECESWPLRWLRGRLRLASAWAGAGHERVCGGRIDPLGESAP